MLVPFDKDLTDVAGTGADQIQRASLAITRRSWNDFFSPASNTNKGGKLSINPSEEFEFQLQIGSKIFPEYAVRSHSEAYYQLRKTLRLQSSKMHSFDFSQVECRDYKFVLAIDTEKVLEAGFTGLDTRAGDLMTVKLKYNGSGKSRLADRIHIVLHSDQILKLNDTGVRVFD